MRIVTNNPDVARTEQMPFDVVAVEGSPFEVLDKVSELLQQGWRLRSTPLPPNVPLMRAPYRSLVIQENDRQYDAAGLTAVEKARERYRIERTKVSTGTDEDFAAIDISMLQRTLRDISLIKTE